MARKKRKKVNSTNDLNETLNFNSTNQELVINKDEETRYDKTQDISAIEMKEYDLETLERMKETLTELLSNNKNNSFYKEENYKTR